MTILFPLIVLLLSALSVCNGHPPPTVPVFLAGTVLPQGNYHVYVRTIPASEVITILKSYDDKIRATEQVIKEQNAAWMRYQVMPGLREERFRVEHTFGVLGDAIVADGTKFEFKLDWKKAHDAYFMHKFDPIYVQIYTLNGPFETSLIERILINPSRETDYVFMYGTPRDQIGPQNNYLLGHISIPTDEGEIVEQYSVKIDKIANSTSDQSDQIGMDQQMVEIDTDGNFAIAFPNHRSAAEEEICLSFYKAQNERANKPVLKPKVFSLDEPTMSLQFGNELRVNIDFLDGKITLKKAQSGQLKLKRERTWEFEGIIQNLPQFDGYKVSRIEVQMFPSNPLALSPSSSSASAVPSPQAALQSVEAKQSPVRNGTFVFKFDGINPAALASVEGKKQTFSRFRTKSLQKPGTIYLLVTPTDVEGTAAEMPHLFQHKLTYPTLTQMDENNAENLSQYRYEFVQNEADDELLDNNNQIGMESEKAKMVELYRAYLKRTNKSADEILSQLNAFKMSLQMVHMKALDSK